MSFFDELQMSTEIQRCQLQTTPIIIRALAGKLSRDEYAAFLLQAYHHVKHTVPLLMLVGARLTEEFEWLRSAVAEYIEEELGHQEWILNDLAACGFDRQRARDSHPNAETELMVAYAYDTVQRISPLGFFGMVQVLEGTSIAVADRTADAIQTSLGLPNRAFSYLRSHGALDQEHVKFFENLMNRIERPQDRQFIIHCARMFYRLYGDIFRSLDAGQALAIQSPTRE